MSRLTMTVFLCLISLPLQGDDEALPAIDPQLKQDYAAAEGVWRRTYRDEAGRDVTVTKTQQGGKSSLTVKDAQGNTLHAHRSEYELQRSGEVRIFKYWNRTVTEGPDAGQIDPQPRRYVYRIAGDRFYEIYGVLTDDERPPTIFVWDRVDTRNEVTGL